MAKEKVQKSMSKKNKTKSINSQKISRDLSNRAYASIANMGLHAYHKKNRN